ncbi:FLYWCH zinc finger domain-containing protein [Phthorimaea operculella]|nr:FLYWCH zinc finger domain-containing protein [Phthorimaea operculella]
MNGAGRQVAPTPNKQLCIYKGYSFFPNSKKSAMSQYWRCTRKSSNCKATLSTTHHGDLIRTHEGHNHYPPRFVIRNGWVRNQSGKHLVLLFNYPFYNDSRNSWRCNKGSSCKARIVLDKNLQIVKANIDHNHAASNFVIKDGVYIRFTTATEVPLNRIQFLKSEDGWKLAFVNGYTFSLNMSRSRNSWRCTRRGDCKARFFISAGTVFTNFQHNHAPYVYEIRNGVLVKIR